MRNKLSIIRIVKNPCYRAFVEFQKFHIKWPQVHDSVYHINVKCTRPSVITLLLLCSHSSNDVAPRTSAERIHSHGTGRRASVQFVITLVVIRFLWHDVNHWVTATSYDKQRILHKRSFHMKLWYEPVASFTNFIWNYHSCKILFIICPANMGFYRLHYFNEKRHCWHGRCQWCYVYALKCYYTCGHTIFMTRRYPLNNSDVIW